MPRVVADDVAQLDGCPWYCARKRDAAGERRQLLPDCECHELRPGPGTRASSALSTA